MVAPISSTRSAALGWAAFTLITLNCGYFLPLSRAYGSSKAVAEELLFFSLLHLHFFLPLSLSLSLSFSFALSRFLSLYRFFLLLFLLKKSENGFCFFWWFAVKI